MPISFFRTYFLFFVIILIGCFNYFYFISAYRSYTQNVQSVVFNYFSILENSVRLAIEETYSKIYNLSKEITENGVNDIKIKEINDKYPELTVYWMDYNTLEHGEKNKILGGKEYKSIITSSSERFLIGKPISKDLNTLVLPVVNLVYANKFSGALVFNVALEEIKKKFFNLIKDDKVNFYILTEDLEVLISAKDQFPLDYYFAIGDKKSHIAFEFNWKKFSVFSQAYYKLRQYPLLIYLNYNSKSDPFYKTGYPLKEVSLFSLCFFILAYFIYFFIVREFNLIKIVLTSFIKGNYNNKLTRRYYINETRLIYNKLRELNTLLNGYKLKVSELILTNSSLKQERKNAENNHKQSIRVLDEMLADKDAIIILNRTLEDQISYLKKLVFQYENQVFKTTNSTGSLLKKCLEIPLKKIIYTSNVLLTKEINTQLIQHLNQYIICYNKLIKTVVTLVEIDNGFLAIQKVSLTVKQVMELFLSLFNNIIQEKISVTSSVNNIPDLIIESDIPLIVKCLTNLIDLYNYNYIIEHVNICNDLEINGFIIIELTLGKTLLNFYSYEEVGDFVKHSSLWKVAKLLITKVMAIQNGEFLIKYYDTKVFLFIKLPIKSV